MLAYGAGGLCSAGLGPASIALSAAKHVELPQQRRLAGRCVQIMAGRRRGLDAAETMAALVTLETEQARNAALALIPHSQWMGCLSAASLLLPGLASPCCLFAAVGAGMYLGPLKSERGRLCCAAADPGLWLATRLWGRGRHRCFRDGRVLYATPAFPPSDYLYEHLSFSLWTRYWRKVGGGPRGSRHTVAQLAVL